ncbi:MAG TPA: 50S ribosomal protein L7ae-like protein [Clostridiaceae bacterium]|nr:50S ribosomal protein L7ae-like protein [Clostridiaceae bacterium]
MIELLKKKEKVVGVKQTKKAAEQDKLEVVFVASDADRRIVEPIIKICESRGIKINTENTMKQLGKAAGIDVGAAIAGILRS